MRIWFRGPCEEEIMPETSLLLKRDDSGALWYKVGRDISSHFHIIYPGDEVVREYIARKGLEEDQREYFREVYALIEDTQFLLQAPKQKEIHSIERKIIPVAINYPLMYRFSMTDEDPEIVPTGSEATITPGSIIAFCGLEFVYCAERERPKPTPTKGLRIRLGA